MKKSMICILLTLIVSLTTISVSATKMGDGIVLSPGMEVNASRNDDDSITVSWGKVSQAIRYEVSLFQKEITDLIDPDDNNTPIIGDTEYFLVRNAVVNASDPCTFTFNADEENEIPLERERDYHIEVYAVKSDDSPMQYWYGECELNAESEDPMTDDPIIKTGTDIILMEDGNACWLVNSGNGISSFLVVLYGEKGNKITEVIAEADDRSVDLSSYMTEGERYYVTMTVRSKDDTVSSPITRSETAVYDPSLYAQGTLTCDITSFLNKNETITLTLINKEMPDDITVGEVAGNTTIYRFDEVFAGKYILRVAKKNHVTRDYIVTVKGDVSQDVKIQPIGDVSGDGKVTTKDFGMAYACAQHLENGLDAYQIACGDVVKNDGKITTTDAARINAHVQKTDPLW